MPLTPKLKDRLRLAGKSGKLILNFLKLDRLPAEFEQLTSITELRLRGNKVKELPPWVANCRGLRELDLAFNPISALPDFLADLPELRLIRLEETKIRSLPASFGRLRKIEELWLSAGVRLPPAPRVKAAAEHARKMQEEMDRAEEAAAVAAAPAPAPAPAQPRPKAPWKRLGGVASMNASLSVLLADASRAGAWDGPRSPLKSGSTMSRLAKSKFLSLGGVVVVDSAAGVGTADVLTAKGVLVAAVEPDWDWLVEEVADARAAADAILAAMVKGGKPLGRIDVPSGRLAIASSGSDLTEYAAVIKRLKPGVGSAKDLEEDGVVVGVKPGSYAIERCAIPLQRSLQACAIVLRRE